MLFVLVLFVVTVCGKRVTPEECNEIRRNSSTQTEITSDSYRLTFGLYIGNVCAAHNDAWLDRENITVVISLYPTWDSLPYRGKRKIKFYHFPGNDTINDEEELAEYLTRKVGILIHSIIYIDSKKVLLHSQYCISKYSKIVRWYSKYFPLA